MGPRLRRRARRAFYWVVHAVLPAGVRRRLRAAVRRAVPNYLSALELIHDELRPRTYVEIGVKHGRSLARARPETLCIGIDPEPRLEQVPRGAKIFALESDDFFRSHDLQAELGGLPVELAFIDGLHSFEFALRDFLNLEKFAVRASVIAIHDCYPEDEKRVLRERTSDFRDGVWKLIVCLRKYRPDLRVSVVEVPPTGLGLVTRLDPSSRVLEKRYDEIVRALTDVTYDEVASAKAEKLNIAAPDPERVRAIVRSAL